MTALRGVNLGGWLILERWMTPSLFDGTDAQDEYGFMAAPDAAARIARHRDTFVTADDFAWLKGHGIDIVRIPVGFWVLADSGPYLNARATLDRAFEDAHAHGIKVLLDLHGLPGSQNGHDHSGKSGAVRWQKEARFRAQSLDVLRGLAERYGAHPALWGLQVINEPNAGVFQIPLRTYYARAYRMLDRLLPPGIRIVYSDAWSPRLLTLSLLGHRRAVMDVHLYHMTTLGAARRPLEWFYRALTRRARLLGRLSRLHPIIIGEWSGVISGELYKRYPETEENEVFPRYVALQQELYAGLTASFYWNYRTEEPGPWNYRAMVEAGAIGER